MRNALTIVLILSGFVFAQKTINNQPFAHTFSIVAMDEKTMKIIMNIP